MNMTSPAAHLRSLCLASAVVLTAALAGSSAQAQVTQLTAAPSAPTATTAQYPVNNGFIKNAFSSTLGTANTATFTATATGPRVNSFETFVNSAANGTPLDFPVDTVVINTFDGGDNSTHTVTGPLNISFASGVSSFGLNVESARVDTAIFTFTAFSGTNTLGTFTYAPVTQTANNPRSIFIGAQAFGGQQITSVLISDTSNALGNTDGTNDFYFGPLSTYNSAPVPEASTTVSFGLLLMLGLGGAVLRKKTSAAKASAA